MWKETHLPGTEKNLQCDFLPLEGTRTDLGEYKAQGRGGDDAEVDGVQSAGFCGPR